MSGSLRNLLLRVLTAAVLLPPVLWAVFTPRPEFLAIAVHLAAVVALAELYWMAMPDDPLWVRLTGVALGLGLSVVTIWFRDSPLALSTMLMATVMVAAAVVLLRPNDIERAASKTALMVFGVLYVPLLLTALAALKWLPAGHWWIVLVLSVTWLSDTFAYFAGRALGKHKLYPAISPGKTWEGAVGGVAGALVAAVVAKLWYLPGLSWLDVVLLGALGSALGQIGDLTESMLKRSFGAKDSGKILPGHGGLLDRIDALLFVAPYTYLYAVYIVLPRMRG